MIPDVMPTVNMCQIPCQEIYQQNPNQLMDQKKKNNRVSVQDDDKVLKMDSSEMAAQQWDCT